MKKILLTCDASKKYSYDLAPKLHGWLMEHMNSEMAEYFHISQVNPYSLRVLPKKDMVLLDISILDESVEKVFDEILLDNSLEKIVLGNNSEITLKITNREVTVLSTKQLADIFYVNEPRREMQINFLTATGFKVKGEQVYLPDILLIFQNLMLRYATIFEGSNKIDKELLQEIANKTKIVSFSIQSSYYPIHGRYIPGFIGKIKIRCNGSKTLISYLNMLLCFAEYSGIGIKTSMGMGAVNILLK